MAVKPGLMFSILLFFYFYYYFLSEGINGPVSGFSPTEGETAEKNTSNHINSASVCSVEKWAGIEGSCRLGEAALNKGSIRPLFISNCVDGGHMFVMNE